MNKTSDIAIFDCHFHIIEKEFPLQVNNGYIPDEFTIENYYDRLRDYSIQGGAVVSGSFHVFTQTYLTSALNRLGPAFVGVHQLHDTVNAAELLDCDRTGRLASRHTITSSCPSDSM